MRHCEFDVSVPHNPPGVLCFWFGSDIAFGAMHHSGCRSHLLTCLFCSIWMSKWSVLEFLKRCTGQFWRRSHELGLQIIYGYLVLTFLAVVIGTLAECQPFTHYWQVIPDPGPRCRQGFVQLITMATCDVTSDLLLVIFPISIVVMSRMRTKRKVSLVLLFGLSLILVAITVYRAFSVISRHGSQQFRSLIASLEILAAASVANAVVIGSFIRDRGVKKAKYKRYSVTDSIEYSSSTRRPTITTCHHWGSDADLVSDVGMRLDPEIQSQMSHARRDSGIARPAPVVVFGQGGEAAASAAGFDRGWRFGRNSMVTNVDSSDAEAEVSTSDDVGASEEISHQRNERSGQRSSHNNTGKRTTSSSRPRFLPNIMIPPSQSSHHNAPVQTPSPKSQPVALSFFDVGGLLNSPHATRHHTSSHNSTQTAQAQNTLATTAPDQTNNLDLERGRRPTSPTSSHRSSLSPSLTHVQDFARQQRNYVRFGGRAVLNDVGGLISGENSSANDTSPYVGTSNSNGRRPSLSPTNTSTGMTQTPHPQSILRTPTTNFSHPTNPYSQNLQPRAQRASISSTTPSSISTPSSAMDHENIIPEPSSRRTSTATAGTYVASSSGYGYQAGAGGYRPSTAGGSSTATTAVPPNNGNVNRGRNGGVVDGMVLSDAGGLLS